MLKWLRDAFHKSKPVDGQRSFRQDKGENLLMHALLSEVFTASQSLDDARAARDSYNGDDTSREMAARLYRWYAHVKGQEALAPQDKAELRHYIPLEANVAGSGLLSRMDVRNHLVSRARTNWVRRMRAEAVETGIGGLTMAHISAADMEALRAEDAVNSALAMSCRPF